MIASSFGDTPAPKTVSSSPESAAASGRRRCSFILRPSETGIRAATHARPSRHDLCGEGILSKQVVLLRVKFGDSIDKTSAGKLNKVAVREKYR